MAFSDYLSQIFGKKAIWLYKIVVPGVATYYVTSRSKKRGNAPSFLSSAGKPDATFLIDTGWTSMAILNGGVTQTTQSEKAEVMVSLPTTSEIAQAVINYDGQADVSVSIWQTFVGDPDEEYASKFAGRVVTVRPVLLAVDLVCEEGFTAMSRSSVAQVIQRPCRHAHYFTNDDGGGCRLDIDDWKQAVSITVATGKIVTVPLAALQPDGTYTAGVLFWSGNEYFIQSHVGSVLTLEKTPVGLSGVLPAAAEIAPGCNLTPENCIVFGNIANFGGFWFMTETPFDGRAIG